MMTKVVLKSLPDGGYIKLREDYTDLDLLAEVCALDPEKLENLIDNSDFGSALSAPAMMPGTCPSAREDGIILRKENSLNKPLAMLPGCKRTRSLEASDDNTTNQNTLLMAKNKRAKRININHHQGPSLPPDMPMDFNNRILQLAGPDAIISEKKLLIQKKLTMSDVAKNQNRISIPTKQVKDVKFLTDDEERLLSSHDGKNVGSLNVMMIEPSLETSQVNFRMWEMEKGNGCKSSISYVITKTWNKITERNKLKEGMTVQVWTFRINKILWLALVKLPN